MRKHFLLAKQSCSQRFAVDWMGNWSPIGVRTGLHSSESLKLKANETIMSNFLVFSSHFLSPTAIFPNLRVFLCSAASSGSYPNPFVRLKPNIVIVVDANLVPIRQAEVGVSWSIVSQFFNCKTKGSVLQHLYFFCHEGSEQQNYFAELQLESDGFKKLLKERDRMIHLQTWKNKSVFRFVSLADLLFRLLLRVNSILPHLPLS